MIDGEISTLVPEWKRGLGIERSPQCTDASFCQNCASHGHPLDYFSSNKSGSRNLEVLPCSHHECAAVHGRFEEITYQVKGPQQSNSTDRAPVSTSQSTSINYTDIWAQRDAPNSHGSREILCGQGHSMTNQTIFEEQETIVSRNVLRESNARKSTCENPSAAFTTHWDDDENEIRQELRWLKAKYQMQLRELKDQQLRIKSKPSSLSPSSDNMERQKDAGKRFADSVNRKVQNCEEISEAFIPEQMIAAKNFYAGALLPHSLHRATSLPVDAVDV
ncbi:hypothetical protein OIU77_011758 [Salix suchowensis]|uniref:Uncharacterized protein n=1 Tax=Salix suchowensis TaxID=1278906 RepID=A0ABQ9A294_9ROSI|nr:hypothetical protein OIU77_011758 [Salix suchowensis]KAJ6321743.1 hypothetical protein OIU77_011758 [Salix suchowensis]